MRKGMVLITILGTIAVLSIAGAIGAYVINQETRSTVQTKSSIKALRAAQSGVEEALVWLKNGGNTFPKTISGSVSGATYQVTVTKTGSNTEIVSIGTTGNAQRKVEVTLTGGGTFYPFAINGRFDITGIDATPWTDATMAVVDIDSSDKSDLENATFTVKTFPSLELPKAADIDENLIFGPLNNGTCDIGSPGVDVYLSRYSNIEGKVICGKNIHVDTSLDIDNITLLAEENIYIKDELSDKGRKSNWNVTIAAKKKVIFDDKIKFTGKTDGGYNLLVYAGEEIDGNNFSQGVITVTARQDATKESSIFFITPGTINFDSTFLWQTGKTDTGSNFVLWADKGVNVNDSPSIHLTGSCPGGNERNFAFIVADGDVSMKKLDFKNNTHPSGLTYEEIKDYCDNGASIGIPDFYRNLYCELKSQIDNGSGQIHILQWKEY